MSKNRIFYYTGSGNSLWVARELANLLGDAQVVSVMTEMESLTTEGGQHRQRTGIVFPVYVWGVPTPVLDFLTRLAVSETGYLFAIATNAGQVSNTLVQLKGECTHHGLKLASGFSIVMPSSYIPWGGAGTPQKCQRLYEEARKKLATISRVVSDYTTQDVEKGALWERVILSYIYKKSLPYLPLEDKRFWVDERCDACGICSRVCPAQNIEMEGSKPSWRHRCHQCFACLHWCPREALQWGKRTPRFARYRHPDLSLKDMLKR